ncbi:MAG: phosphoribosyltransferase family protein, partial [Candidatus Ranarchaeia archaeon]
QFRLAATNLLRLLKRTKHYNELSRRTGFPVQDLNKYVRGRILPGIRRAMCIINRLELYASLREEIRRQCTFDTHGFLDNTVLVSDRIILDLLGFVAFQEFGDIKVNKVLTAAVDGVPLATIISKALNADLVIAKKGNEVGIEETLQTRVTVGKTGLMFQLVVGQKQLKRGDIVLIVDDIIRDGATQRALLRLAFKAKTIVKGIFIPISIGREWSREGLQPEIKFKPFLQISP